MAKKAHLTATLGLSLFTVVTMAAGCGSAGDSSGSLAGSDTTGGSAERAIVEADIIQVDSGRLYALAASGTVSVVDISTPGQLNLLGQVRVAGQPFEMYRRGDLLVTMWNGAFAVDGSAVPPRTDASTSTYTPQPPRDPNSGAGIIVLDMHDPKHMTPIATFPVPGEMADSRIVGDVLYLATYENAQCYRCGTVPRTLVTSFNLQNPLAISQVDQASFQSNAPDSYNLPWGLNWKRSIFVNQQRLYIGGHADIDPNQLYNNTGTKEGIIDVLDITDPTGRLGRGARIEVAGAMLSRWQLDEKNGVLRVISQRGAGRTGNGLGTPEVDTFTIASTQSFLPLGHTTLKLPRQEGLRAVRFDSDRAYAITYNQTDPLFTIDLSNPAAPRVRGELFMPGFMFYLEPYGNRLIGLGIDRNDPLGSLNVSLFDVQNLDRPQMIKRVSFGATNLSEDYEILNYELPEDQDRIQKAFHVFADGIVAMPFIGSASRYSGSGNPCDSFQSGVQLIDWANDTLVKRALLPVRGNPRRAFENNGEMVTVSDSNVRSFSLASRDIALQTADLTIGTCTPYSYTDSYYEGHYQYDYYYPRRRGFFGCSVALPGSAASAGPSMGALAACLLGLLGLLARTRTARSRRS